MSEAPKNRTKQQIWDSLQNLIRERSDNANLIHDLKTSEGKLKTRVRELEASLEAHLKYFRVRQYVVSINDSVTASRFKTMTEASSFARKALINAEVESIALVLCIMEKYKVEKALREVQL